MLCLIASTHHGADLLSSFGWEAVRHSRTEIWPVIEEGSLKDEYNDYLSSASSIGDRSHGSSSVILPQYLYSDDQRRTPSPQSSVASGTSPRAGFYFEEQPKSQSSTADNTLLDKPRANTAPEFGESPDRSVIAHRNSESLDDRLSDKVVAPMPLGRTRQDSHQSSEWSESDGFHTPPNILDPSGSAPLIITETEVTVHGRSQSDTHPAGEKLETQISVHFAISENEQKEERTVNNIGAKDSLEQPVIRQRSSSAEAAQGRAKTTTFRDDRSGSNESSHTNKSHSDSVNTDTTTSGISSYESGAHIGTDAVALSPIPSASSMAMENSKPVMAASGVYSNTEVSNIDNSSMHPADVVRRLANLKRVPSLRRRYSNPTGMGQQPSPIKTIPGKQLSESMIIYTSPRDAQGYATLREIQRNRTFVGDMVGPTAHLTFDEAYVPKTRSLDFRLGKPRYIFSILYPTMCVFTKPYYSYTLHANL